MGASVSAIPQSLYDEIKDEIAPAELEPIDVTIMLANRDTICPVGIVRDVEVMCGKTKYPTDFLVLATAQDSFCPIIFGRPYLNIVNSHIDCVKQTVTVGFGGVSHEFNFSKFGRQPHEKESYGKDEIIALASIVVPPTDPLEQYLLEHENDMHMDERDEIDRIVVEQYPLLKNNLPVELLGVSSGRARALSSAYHDTGGRDEGSEVWPWIAREVMGTSALISEARLCSSGPTMRICA
jgi:hypothetical protein